MTVRLPGTGNCSCRKCGPIRSKLGTQAGFGMVIGQKIPQRSVPGARPEPGAAATVVAWFVTQQHISHRGEAVLNCKLAVSRGHAARIASASIPLRRTVIDLISNRK